MRADIVIRTIYGQVTVRAIVRGPFAFVPSDRERGGWSVTHIPTGLAMHNGQLQRRTAMNYMRHLLAQPIDWEFTNNPTSPAWKKAHAIVAAWTEGNDHE